MNAHNACKQFYIPQKDILLFAKLIEASELRNCIGFVEGDCIGIGVHYDEHDEEHLDYIRDFQAIDDGTYEMPIANDAESEQ